MDSDEMIIEASSVYFIQWMEDQWATNPYLVSLPEYTEEVVSVLPIVAAATWRVIGGITGKWPF